MKYWLLIVCTSILTNLNLQAQDDSTAMLHQLPSGYLERVSSKARKLEEKLDRKSEKALRQFAKQEAGIKKKLQKMDSISASSIFSNSIDKYKQLEQKLITPGKLTQYLPKLDSLATSLKFLENNPQFLSVIKDGKEKLKVALEKVNGLESRLQKAEDIKAFLKERKRFLKEELSKLGFTKQLKKLNKQVFYYSLQINEYKKLLSDSKKAEQKALELLSKTKLFRDFMKKNSFLASLFPMPGTSVGGQASQTGFAGLQTRVQITSFIQQTGLAGPNTASQLQQNIQDVQSQVTQIRNKISQMIGENGNDLEMPDFKPNNQKTKSFLKRVEYGANFQSQKASSYFPVISDLGLSAGYRLNDKSIIGLGASYKIGWGHGWNDIRLTSQGIGLRSFIDWKVKGELWITGGYEQNYRSAFNRIDQLQNLNAWQQSGLIGMSKIFSLKTKFLKKTKLQLLWDFLSYQQKPKTRSLLFRAGYNF